MGGGCGKGNNLQLWSFSTDESEMAGLRINKELILWERVKSSVMQEGLR